MFGKKFVAALNVNRDSVVGNQAFQLHGKNGECFTEGERSAKVLAKLKQCLCLLARGRDGREEVGVAAGGSGLLFKPSRRRSASFHLHVRGELGERNLLSAFFHQVFEIAILLAQDFDDARVESFARFRLQPFHDFLKRKSTAVLAIGGKSVKEVDGGENAGAYRDLFKLKAKRITGTVPF